MSGSQWTWRTNFWRYYLIDGLQPYNEANEATWYGNQMSILTRSLSGHWKKLFSQVFELAGPNFLLQRYALTGQTQGQEQELHGDTSNALSGDFRSYLIYLNTSWDSSWGGVTEFAKNNQITHIEYPEPGKLIEFDSQAQHRGQGPNKSGLLRLSLVLHGKII